MRLCISDSGDPVSDWNSFFSDLLSSNDDKCIASLFRFVRSKSYQYRIARHYKPQEILTEVYLRGLEKTKKGEEICKKLAWTRRTSYNVIRELRRDLDKHDCKNLDDISVSRISQVSDNQFHLYSSENEEVDEISREAIRKAFDGLPVEDRALLNLKLIEELPWKKIIDHLSQNGVNIPSETALRQRKHRAVKKLAERYVQYINQSEVDSNSDG